MKAAIHAIRSKRVVTPAEFGQQTVRLKNGLIEAVAGYNDAPSGKHVYDAGDSVVMPGLVDTHVNHINEPEPHGMGRFRDGDTRGAAAGERPPR